MPLFTVHVETKYSKATSQLYLNGLSRYVKKKNLHTRSFGSSRGLARAAVRKTTALPLGQLRPTVFNVYTKAHCVRLHNYGCRGRSGGIGEALRRTFTITGHIERNLLSRDEFIDILGGRSAPARARVASTNGAPRRVCPIHATLTGDRQCDGDTK